MIEQFCDYQMKCKEDNDPKNLVPMCPTHHQYMHSRFKSLINEKVENYRKDWINKNQAPIAQPEEQLICNQLVAGSIPAGSSIF